MQTVPVDQIGLAVKYKTRDCYQDTVESYVEKIKYYLSEHEDWVKEGSYTTEPLFPFPPPKVIKLEPETEYRYECIGGNHTVKAAQLAGLKKIKVEIVAGNDENLLTRAILDNLGHGRPYEKEERENNMFLLSEEGLSVRRIAGIFKYPKTTVHRILKEIKSKQAEDQNTEKKVSKSFDPEARIKKLWAPFEKHPESFTPPMIEYFAQAISDLYENFVQQGHGEVFLEQIEKKLWNTDNDESEY